MCTERARSAAQSLMRRRRKSTQTPLEVTTEASPVLCFCRQIHKLYLAHVSHDQPYPVESKFKFGAKYSSHHHNNGARESIPLPPSLRHSHSFSLSPPLGLEWVKNFSRGSEKWHLFSRIYDTAFSSAVMFSTTNPLPQSLPSTSP